MRVTARRVRAMHQQAEQMIAAGDNANALKMLVTLEEEFGEYRSSAIQAEVTEALIARGLLLGGLRRFREAFEVLDSALTRFNCTYAEAIDPSKLGCAAYNRAAAFAQYGDPDRALEEYDNAIRVFDLLPADEVRLWRVLTLYNQGTFILNRSSSLDTSSATQLLAISKLLRQEERADETNPMIQERTALGDLHRVQALIALGRDEEATATLEEIEAKVTGERPFEALLLLQAAMLRTLVSGLHQAIGRFRELERILGDTETNELARMAQFFGYLLRGEVDAYHERIRYDPIWRAAQNIQSEAELEELTKLVEIVAPEKVEQHQREFASSYSAMMVIFNGLTVGAPFALLLRSFRGEASSLEDEQGYWISHTRLSSKDVETRVHQALPGLPIITIANPAYHGWPGDIPRLIVTDSMWRPIVKLLVNLVTFILVDVEFDSPGVVEELKLALNIGQDKCGILLGSKSLAALRGSVQMAADSLGEDVALDTSTEHSHNIVYLTASSMNASFGDYVSTFTEPAFSDTTLDLLRKFDHIFDRTTIDRSDVLLIPAAAAVLTTED